jgi:hypothetical protein
MESKVLKCCANIYLNCQCLKKNRTQDYEIWFHLEILISVLFGIWDPLSSDCFWAHP